MMICDCQAAMGRVSRLRFRLAGLLRTVTTRATYRPQFSLRTLLIAAPLLAALLGWSLKRIANQKHETVAWIQVDSSAAPRAWARPEEVLLAAVDSLTRESREWIEARGEPLPWLRRQVRVAFVGRSNLATITLRDDSLRPSNPRAEHEIVNALARAFCDASPEGAQVFLDAEIANR